MNWLQKILPIIISGFLILVIVGYAPWAEVGRILSQTQPEVIAGLFGLSLLYYASKVYRYWFMLRTLGIKQPLGAVTLTYLAAQPVTLLPAGELYRSEVLKTYRRVPISQSVPTFTAQGLFEGLGMAALGMLAAILLGIQRVPTLILLVLVIIGVLAIRAGLIDHVARPINALPFIHVSRSRLRGFSNRNKALFSGRAFFVLFGLSLVSELVGASIAYLSIVGLGGSIDLLQATLIYIIPVLVGFISLLPGGLGASEQSAIGLFVLMGVPTALAIAATLVMRTTLMGSGIIYSVIAWPILKHLKRP